MSSFLKELAKAQPIPGGGGAAAQAALTGLALLNKVIALEKGREGLKTEQQEAWQRMGRQAGDLQRALLRLRGSDGRAYLAWVKHRSGAAEGDWARTMAEVPLQIMAKSSEVLALLLQTGVSSKRHLWPDLLAVVELVQGAGRAAARIARSNFSRIKDTRVRRQLAGDLKDQTANLSSLVRESIRHLGGKR